MQLRHILFFLITLSLLAPACKTTQSTTSNTQKGEIDPTNRRKIDVLYVEACTHMIRGDYPSASGLFKEVLKTDPSNHASMYNIAKISIEQRNFNEAIDYGKSALKGDPGNFWYYHTLQQAYEYKGDFANAVSLQEQITSRFPDRMDERLKLAELYIRNEKFDLAIAQLEAIEAKIGLNEQTLMRKLQLFIQSDQQEKAVEVTKNLITLDPYNLKFYQIQYETYQAIGKDDEAIATLDQMLKKDPENGYALLNLAEFYKSKDQLEKSDTYLYRAFSNPGISVNEKMRIVQGLMQYMNTQPEVAPRITKLTGLLETVHPGNPAVYAVKGDLFAFNEKADSARYYYRKAVDIDGSDDRVWMGLLYADFSLEDDKLLQKEAEEALEFFPNKEEFLFFYGVSSANLKSYDEAVYALEKLKKLGVTNLEMLGQSYLQLADIYHETEQFKKSDENFDLALELDPNDHLTLNNYAYYLSLRKVKLEKAASMIEKAVKLQPNQASYEDTYGWVLYNLGRYDEAETWIKKAIEHETNAAELYEHYGDILHKLGKKEKAEEQWKIAIEKGATHFNINEKIGQP